MTWVIFHYKFFKIWLQTEQHFSIHNSSNVLSHTFMQNVIFPFRRNMYVLADLQRYEPCLCCVFGLWLKSILPVATSFCSLFTFYWEEKKETAVLCEYYSLSLSLSIMPWIIEIAHFLSKIVLVKDRELGLWIKISLPCLSTVLQQHVLLCWVCAGDYLKSFLFFSVRLYPCVHSQTAKCITVAVPSTISYMQMDVCILFVHASPPAAVTVMRV